MIICWRKVEDSPWGALNFEPFKFAGLRTKLRSLFNLHCFVEYIVTNSSVLLKGACFLER